MCFPETFVCHQGVDSQVGSLHVCGKGRERANFSEEFVLMPDVAEGTAAAPIDIAYLSQPAVCPTNLFTFNTTLSLFFIDSYVNN